MVCSSAAPSHRLVRDGSSSVGSSGVPPVSQEISYAPSNRQHVGSLLLQQAGGSAVTLSLHSGGGYPAVVFQGGDRHIGIICLRVAKCAGRRSRQKSSSQVHRLDPGQGGSLTSVGGLVRADGSPFWPLDTIIDCRLRLVSACQARTGRLMLYLSRGQISWTMPFFPFALISKVFRRPRLEGARLILIAPWWPGRP